MTIVLVIIAVLILLAVLFLIHRVNQIGDRILSTTTSCYSNIVDYILNLEKHITKEVSTITTIVGSHQKEVVRLTNKVEESNNCSKNSFDSLKNSIANLNDRIVAPIDKINDTHNRVKTLGKGATSSNELRDIIVGVAAEVAKKAVDTVVDELTKQPKTTKKSTKKAVTEVKD